MAPDVEVRDSHEVHLGQCVGGGEELLEILDSLDSHVQGKLAVTGVPLGSVHCDGDPGACPHGQGGVPAHDHTHEVGGEGRTGVKDHRVPQILLYAHVGEHLHPRVRPDHGDVKGGSELWLIETRKTFKGSSGLKVTGGAPAPDLVIAETRLRHLVPGAVEAPHAVVQLPRVQDGD